MSLELLSSRGAQTIHGGSSRNLDLLLVLLLVRIIVEAVVNTLLPCRIPYVFV